ncbi:MAG: Atu4866 domain-containing protein [Agrobacterium tumefaciens]
MPSCIQPRKQVMQNLLSALVGAALATQSPLEVEPNMQISHPYVGLWVTQDGRVRHELLPNNRYVEARGTRERAYEGRYLVTGTHIEYWDDTGFTADGDFINGVLHHGGMILYRR